MVDGGGMRRVWIREKLSDLVREGFFERLYGWFNRGFFAGSVDGRNEVVDLWIL